MSQEPRPRSSYLSLWLIIVLAAAPMAAAYLAYYFWPPAAQTNYGELLEPKPLPEAVLELVDGSRFELSRLRGKWVLATIDSGKCGAYCRQKLYYLRQLRLAQGKDMDRIERVWFVSDEAQPARETAAAYQGTWLVRVSGSTLLAHFPARGAVSDHIYVIDPLGNVMMRYPRDADPPRMVKDLARLLKASRIG